MNQRSSLFAAIVITLGTLAVAHAGEDVALRQWKWHGGKIWAPNGVDTIYRIENRFNGLALTSRAGRVGDPTYVQQFHSVEHALQRFTFEDAGDGYYYIRNQLPEPCYLEQPDPTRRRTTVITLAEVEAFGIKSDGKQEVVVSEHATARHNSGYSGDAYPAANALDGNLTNFSHTGGGPDDWWEMDLKKTFTLTRLVIHNRPYYTAPLRGCTVRFLDENRVSVWSSVLDTVKTDYVFDLKNIKGRYVRVGLEESTDAAAKENVLCSPGKEGNGKKWRIELVHADGFYKIVNKRSGKALRAVPGDFPFARLAAGQPVRQAEYEDGDVFMQWNIEPVRDQNIECLSATQIGWTPKAPKYAVLTRNSPLATAPAFTVTKGDTAILTGQSLYWGSKWRQHFYVINISSLSEQGDYLLVCDGDAAALHVNETAYTKIRHRGGSDTTVLSDVVDGKGFVGHWGRIDTWWTPEVMAEPYWRELDWDVNDKSTCERTKIHEPKKRIAKKYFGGWDHTDLYGSSLKCSAMLLRELVFAYRDNLVKSENRALINEMIYGARYFVSTQNEDGSWPYKTNVITPLAGGVASITGALAIAYEPIKTVDPALAAQMLAAARKGWQWVEANPDKWLPFKVDYRHGHYEERLIASLGLYLATKDVAYRQVAHAMILNAVDDAAQGFVLAPKPEDPCEAKRSVVGIASLRLMLQYYDQAPAKVKERIRVMAHRLYCVTMSDHARSTPFGGLEGSNGGYGSGVAWVRRAAFLYTMYQKFGEEYGAGYLVAERVMDWTFGCNPYATSLVFGCGDVFAVYGWVRGYEKGSLLPGLAINFDKNGMVVPIQLTATQQGYGNAESEAGAGVAFIHAMALREVLKDHPPKMVSFYGEKQYQSWLGALPAGSYNEGQMQAYGIRTRDISSVKIPAIFKVTLYDKATLDGTSIELTDGHENLQDAPWDNKTRSIRIAVVK